MRSPPRSDPGFRDEIVVQSSAADALATHEVWPETTHLRVPGPAENGSRYLCAADHCIALFS